MNYTSTEQSKKLLELGLSPESADMIHICSIIRGKENGFLDAVPKESILYAMHTTIEEKEKSIPCWSLGALLQSAPKYFSELNHQFVQTIEYDHIMGVYYFIYRDYQHGGRSKNISNSKDLFDGTFKMIVWLLKNGYIKPKTSHRITKEEKSGKIVANQGIGMETAE
jgi:hypothetical protein